jgi:hypothetical protein
MNLLNNIKKYCTKDCTKGFDVKLENHHINEILLKFKERLYISDKMEYKLINIEENPNSELKNKFLSKIKKNSKILELYHVCRNNTEEDTKSIFANGFRENYNPFSNKGIGTYFANHGRYPLTWVGCDVPVLICYIIFNEEDNLVERYKSEIYSPGYSSEYKVKDNSLIYPAYILRYNVKGRFDNTEKCGYVEHGQFGCLECDTKNKYGNPKRCDCKYDYIDKDDIIFL